MATKKANTATVATTNNAAQEQIALMSRIAELEAMQAELKELKAKQKNKLRLKVSQKGGIWFQADSTVERVITEERESG